MGEDGRTAWENAAGREEAEPLFQIAVDYTCLLYTSRCV